jgi:hypothetical protein
MPRRTAIFIRNAALTAIAAAGVTALTGCYSSSGTALGFRPNPIVQDRFAVTDSIGAAMFAEQVRLAHAEANDRRLERSDFATVPLAE